MMRTVMSGATIALLSLSTAPLDATAAVLYSDTFEPGDSVGYTVSPTMGNPEVVGPAGLMTTNSLELSGPNATDCTPEGSPFPYSCYDQPFYDMHDGTGVYSVSFDLDLSELNGSLSIFADVPYASSLRFISEDSRVYGMGAPAHTYNPDELLQFTILLDFQNGYQHVILNGDYLYAGSWDFSAGGRYSPGFSSLRFSLPAGTDAADSAARIDNLLVTTAVPVPAAAWLFGSGLLALGWRRRSSSV
jgi:hypothetical protein